MDLVQPRDLGGGAGRPGGAARPAADRRRHRRDGGHQLRPEPSRRPARPDPHRRDRDVVRRGRRAPDRCRRHLRAGRVRPRRAGARAGDGLAHGRLAADPQPGHGRRQPRLRVPGRRRAPAAAGRGGHRRGGVGARPAARRGGRLLHRREAQRARARRADPGRARPGHRRAAAVRQDRHPQRDGDRGGFVRPRAAPRRATGRHRHRVGRPHAPTRTGGRGPACRRARLGRPGAARRVRRTPVRGARRRGRRPDRRRPRQRGVPPARARRAGRPHR